MTLALKMALLMLVCVMMMMLSLGAQAAPQKHHQGKASADHKPPKEDGLPKFHFILEQEIKVTSGPVRLFNNDSISPWEYIKTYDPNRIPSEIDEARCLLTGCLNSRGIEVLEVESRPIFRQILVLRRVRGDEKNYFFKMEYKTVAMGCTCVRPYVKQI